MSRQTQIVHDHADTNSRVTYDRFIEFERLMRAYPSSNYRGANPTPIGLCAFALTLFVYSMYNAGATVPVTASLGVAMGLALFYGGLIQLIAGILEFRLGNNFGALFFCSYAGFFLSLAALYVSAFSFTSGYSADTSVQLKALGVYYLGWTIFTTAMLISAVRLNLVYVLLLFFLTLTYILLTASNFLLADPNTQRAGGAFGIVTAVIAWFGAFASLLKKGENSYFNLPMFSLAPKDQPASIDKHPVEIRTQ